MSGRTGPGGSDAPGEAELPFAPARASDRIVLVGERNPYGPAEEFALYCWPEGSAGHRLRRILGVDEDRYLAFRRLNLCSGPWDRTAARRSAARLYDELAAWTGRPSPVVILLGTKASEAFASLTIASRAGLARPCGLSRWEIGADALERARWLSLPHPSGLCRAWGPGMWSPGGTVDRSRALLCDLAPHVPWGPAGAGAGAGVGADRRSGGAPWP